MKKVILYISLSLDGYIADTKGGIDWLGGECESYKGDYGYADFISNIDTVIMGYTTYHQVTTELSQDVWPYEKMTTYVLTHKKKVDSNEIRFTNEPIADLVKRMRKQDGKSIWICGGANVINQSIKQDYIDEYQLSIMPILLGDGIRLFDRHETAIPLELVSSTTENGVLNCVYKKR